MKERILILLLTIVFNSYGQSPDLFIVREKGMFGFIDIEGEIIIPLQYLDANPFEGKLAAVKSETGWFFIDENNNRKSDFFEELIWPHDEHKLALVQSGDSVAYINENGKTIFKEIPPYESSYRIWSEGHHAIKIKGLWGLIDTTGQIIIQPQYPNIGEVREGVFYAEHLPEGEFYEFSDKEGEIYKTRNEDSLNNLDPCYYKISRNDLGWYINLKNEKIFKTPNGYNFGGFFEGLSKFTIEESGKWTYIDKKGKLFHKTYDDCENFMNGIARVGIVLNDEKKLSLDDIDLDTTTDKCTGKIMYISYRDSENRKLNFINKKGDFLNKYFYKKAGDFINGQAIVAIDSLYGTIDTKGKTIIPLNYKNLFSFNDSLFAFTKDSLWGVMNYQGKIIVEAKYNECGGEGNYIFFRTGDKWGIMDSKGQIIKKAQYNFITQIDSKNKIIGYYEGKVPNDVWSYKVHQLFYSESPSLTLGYETFDGKIIWKPKN